MVKDTGEQAGLELASHIEKQAFSRGNRTRQQKGERSRATAQLVFLAGPSGVLRGRKKAAGMQAKEEMPSAKEEASGLQKTGGFQR